MYLPNGYVKANGATVNRADYPRLVNLASAHDLWTATPVTYPALFGIGDGSTTMVLPDWRGVVARYFDDGKGYDVDRLLGTYQEDMFQNHTHYTTSSGWVEHGGNTSGGTGVAFGNSGANTVASGRYGSETRMKNIAEMAVIRA